MQLMQNIKQEFIQDFAMEDIDINNTFGHVID